MLQGNQTPSMQFCKCRHASPSYDVFACQSSGNRRGRGLSNYSNYLFIFSWGLGIVKLNRRSSSRRLVFPEFSVSCRSGGVRAEQNGESSDQNKVQRYVVAMQGKGKFEGKNQGKTDDKVQGGLERATPAEGHMSRVTVWLSRLWPRRSRVRGTQPTIKCVDLLGSCSHVLRDFI